MIDVCVLVIGIDVDPRKRLMVAANRDELYARPASGPEVHVWNGRRVLAPRDLQAGGTWTGVSETGLVVVITNRPDGDYDAERASRGALCREALGQPSAQDVDEWIRRVVHTRRFNSFNFFYADAHASFVASWNGTLRVQSLGAGTHVLSNLHALGELRIPELDALPADAGPLRTHFVDVLASHEPRDGGDFRICKHGERYGTVSSSLIYTTPDGAAVLEHAPGAPCVTPFATYRLPPA